MDYLIIYLYSDGLFEVNEAYRLKVGNCLHLDDLTKERWVIRDKGPWMRGKTRKEFWAVTVMERKG